MDVDLSIFQRRRARLRGLIGPDAAALVASPAPRVRSADGEYPYRANSNVLYLSGFDEPETVVLVLPDTCVLFVPPRDREREQWTGRRAGVEGAVERFGVELAHPLGELREQLEAYLEHVETLYLPFTDAPLRELAFDLTARLRNRKHKPRGGPRAFGDLDLVMGRLRVIKEPAELELMRMAGHISALGHLAARDAIRPGVHEYQVEAAIDHAFRKEGATGPAYETIVGAGVNATILHYVRNDTLIRQGDAVLVDAGAEFAGYAGDITRTYPASGRFTPEQRTLYQLVLAAELAGIDAARVGNHVRSPHEAAVGVLVDGLLDLGLLEGSRDEVLEEERFKRFFMHGTSHFLGLDTHDVGEYYGRADGTPLPLQPGMVLTVEPGLYLSADDETIAERWRGIGIRIEDDVVVTADGAAPEILTHEAPKALDDLER